LRCLLVSFSLVYASLLAGCGDRVERIPIVEDKCSKCHNTDRIYSIKRSEYEWDRIIHGMKVRGLKLSEQEEKKLMKELYDKLGSDKK